ncbi:hypothetical protein J4730_16025 [Klebsiella pneumoniae]|uniref:Uncharacterized protein n=1 Tax=Klebsiella pneumoniae TaxID=573 RepID=A0A939SQK0_KLEPN|nr:hypothetical protein [Klebsiella pneumoniae]
MGVFRETLRGIPLPTRQAQRRREDTTGAIPPLCRMALRLSGLREPPVSSYTPARQAQRRREDTSGAIPAFVPDGGFALSAYGILP